MPAIFSKNCVYSGTLDSYCLPCSDHLPTQEDVMEHICTSVHKANLKELGYFEKYKNDFIRKVKSTYFCELCNMIFPTAAKVGLHVTEESHLVRKKSGLVKHMGNLIVFQDNILISENAWNGFIDDTCVLCNVEFDEESSHKNEQGHVLNLIKSSLTFGADNAIYRKFDGIHQCLTCNKIVAENLIALHFDSAEHKNAIKYAPKMPNNDSLDTRDIEGNKEVRQHKKKHDDNKKKLLMGAQAKVDGKSLYTKPVLMKNKKATSPDHEDVVSLVKHHGFADDSELCNKIQNPRKGSKSPNIPKKIKKINFEKFAADLKIHETHDAQYIIINEKFYLMFSAFLGLMKFNNRVICQVCHIDLTTHDNVMMHINTSKHKYLIENCFVITSLDNEFIREFSSDLYDCPCCATVTTDWDDMLDHLNTAEHKSAKDECDKLLRSFIENRERGNVLDFNPLLMNRLNQQAMLAKLLQIRRF